MPTKIAVNEKIDFLSDDVNETIATVETLPFKEILCDTLIKIKDRKFLNGIDVSQEVKEMDINILGTKNEIEDLELYTNFIDKISAFRGRLTPILSKAHSDFLFVEKHYESLYKSWVAKFSKLGSDKKREGEAEYILRFMLDERILRENLYNSVKNVMNSLNGKMEAVSRKITIMQESHKLIGYTGPDNRKEKKKNFGSENYK